MSAFLGVPMRFFIVLKILHASLAASKSQLSRHMWDKPLIDKITKLLQTEVEREELRMALVALQESTGKLNGNW